MKQWLTPNGQLIRNQGIKPDVEVKLPLGTDLLTPDEVTTMTIAQINASTDTQLVKALESLRIH